MAGGPEREQIAAALPGYEIGEELGRGAWGVVFGAEHTGLNRKVAIKLLAREYGEDPDVRRRFVSEARLLASFDHPHIVPIFDFVEREGICLLVMERLAGGTVAQRFRRGGYTPQEACAVIVAACAGLDYAHGKGVLHRDIKPENLMFSGEGVLKVTDFGIARVVGGSASLATKSGFVVGTPAYIAPEQATGEEITAATDVYAAGLVLFELLAGVRPFPEARDPVVALYQHVHQSPMALREAAPVLPAELEVVTSKALEREAGDRYPSAAALAAALDDVAAALWGRDWMAATGFALRSGPRAAATVVTPAPAADGPAAPLPAARRRTAAVAAAGAIAVAGVGVALLAGGGGDGGGDGRSTTSVPTTGAVTPAARDALAVAKAWLAAYHAGDDARAASYFASGVNANGNILRTRQEAIDYLAALGCSGPLTGVRVAGAQITLVQNLLRSRPGRHPPCDIEGWEIVMRVRDGKIVDWR